MAEGAYHTGMSADESSSRFPARRRVDRTTLPKIQIATNRKARHDFAISYTLEAGLMLVGSEVKSLRNGGASLQDGFARLERGELWLYGVHIPPLAQASHFNHEPRRKRKCLVHRREIEKLGTLVEGKGTTIVPLSLHFRGSRAKVELGVGRGKRQFDKREDLKKKTAERDVRRAMRRG
jgi:SsrA-binding protein